MIIKKKLNTKETKCVNSQKFKEDHRSERNYDLDKAEEKQLNEDVKKTTELKDKLKDYLSRAKEATENKKK